MQHAYLSAATGVFMHGISYCDISRVRESRLYTFEHELLKRQLRFNCNTLCRRAFNECNECVFTFPVLSLSREWATFSDIEHAYIPPSRVAAQLTSLEFIIRSCKREANRRTLAGEICARTFQFSKMKMNCSSARYAGVVMLIVAGRGGMWYTAVSSVVSSIRYLC